MVAAGETTAAAIAVVDKAIALHSVPPRLLSDDGSRLTRPGGRFRGQPVERLSRLGAQAITAKPTTGQERVLPPVANIT